MVTCEKIDIREIRSKNRDQVMPESVCLAECHVIGPLQVLGNGSRNTLRKTRHSPYSLSHRRNNVEVCTGLIPVVMYDND